MYLRILNSCVKFFVVVKFK